MKFKNSSFLLFLFSFFFFENSSAQHYKGSQRAFVIPVVKEKMFTSLLRITIMPISMHDAAGYLKQITLDFGNTFIENEISSIKVYCNTDSSYLTEEKIFQSGLFAMGASQDIKNNKLELRGNLRLMKDTNYVWIGMSLKKSAKVGNIFSLKVSDILIDEQSLELDGNVSLFRIASAVRQSMQDNVQTSRIPGIATATNGDLLAIYDARYDSKRDLQGDIDIALNRSTDKGNTWLPIQRIIDMGRWGGLPEKFNGVSDPCILVDERSGVIFVAGLWMHGLLDGNGQWMQPLSDTSTVWNHQWRNKGSQPGFDPKQTAQFLIVKSTDNGKTWSKPVNITKMCKKEEWWLWAPAPGRGFTMSDGTLVLPTQGRDKNGAPFSNITYSKDGGVTWVTSNPASTGTSECAAAQLSDGSVMLNMRTNANKGLTGEGNGRAIAVTSNLGKTWAEHNTSRKALPEPVCMGSLYKHTYFKDGRKKSVLLFLNPNSTTGRNHITLKASFDNGNTWPSQKYILLDELSGFGYSCITSVDNDTIGVLYESSQAQLVFQQISLKEITE